MKDHLFHVLNNLGLEEKEVLIYLALIELGEASVLEISRQSGVNRVSIYYILEKMKKAGRVTHSEKDGRDFFMAVDPRLLLAQEKQYVKEFETMIPQFKSMMSADEDRPRVRFFEGIHGVKAVYADTLTAQTEILNYANSQEVRDYWPEYDLEYVARRAAKKIHLRGIAPDDEQGRRVKAQDSDYFREMRLIDPKKLNFGNEIHIYNHKIAMVSFKDEPFGIIIESRALTETQRSIFEMAWGFAGSA